MHVLDEFDKKLLQLLQRNNQLSFDQLGAEVGLSASAARRRVKALRDVGIIAQDVSIVDPSALGITVIVSIRFEKESPDTYEQFKRAMAADPCIAQCYTVSGDVDFILIGHFSSLKDYDQWVNDKLLTNHAIARSTTNVVYRRVKFSTAVSVS